MLSNEFNCEVHVSFMQEINEKNCSFEQNITLYYSPLHFDYVSFMHIVVCFHCKLIGISN